MSTGVYASRTQLFTLKGPIAIQLLDGEEIEGEFATQDAYNIFIMVDGEPLMVPRLQIRWIRGLEGQPIERDTSQAALEDPLSTQPLPTPADSGPPTEISTVVREPVREEEADEGTLVIMSEAVQSEFEEEDEDDGTLILVADESLGVEDEEEEDEDEDEGTVMLPSSEIAAALAPPAVVDDDEKDMTMVLGRDIEIPDELMADEVFSSLMVEPKEPVATLTCKGGPHTGDVFTVKTDGITTIGRSTDNVVVLSRDKEISRRHAIIIYESSRYVVQDQNSLNGTFVNDEQITSPRFLEPGDVVLVGVSPLHFKID